MEKNQGVKVKEDFENLKNNKNYTSNFYTIRTSPLSDNNKQSVLLFPLVGRL